MAKTSSLTPEMLAAFAAKGGKVQKLDANESSGMTARDWYKAARDPAPVAKVIDDGIDEAIAERQFEIGAGMGLDALNDFNAGVQKHGRKAMLGWK